MDYVDGLAKVGEVFFVKPLKEMTQKERERVADCLSGLASDILKHEACEEMYALFVYE